VTDTVGGRFPDSLQKQPGNIPASSKSIAKVHGFHGNNRALSPIGITQTKGL
jgi:hypothetical protein